jgi:hypothetical protein
MCLHQWFNIKRWKWYHLLAIKEMATFSSTGLVGC